MLVSRLARIVCHLRPFQTMRGVRVNAVLRHRLELLLRGLRLLREDIVRTRTGQMDGNGDILFELGQAQNSLLRILGGRPRTVYGAHPADSVGKVSAGTDSHRAQIVSFLVAFGVLLCDDVLHLP